MCALDDLRVGVCTASLGKLQRSAEYFATFRAAAMPAFETTLHCLLAHPSALRSSHSAVAVHRASLSFIESIFMHCSQALFQG